MLPRLDCLSQNTLLEFTALSFSELDDDDDLPTGVKRSASELAEPISNVTIPEVGDKRWKKLMFRQPPKESAGAFERKREVLKLTSRIAGIADVDVGGLGSGVKNFKNSSLVFSTFGKEKSSSSSKSSSLDNDAGFYGDRFVLPPKPSEKASLREREEYLQKSVYFQFVGNPKFYKDDYKKTPNEDDYEHMLSKNRSNLNAHLWMRFGADSGGAFTYYGPMTITRWDMLEFGNDEPARPTALFKMNITVSEYLSGLRYGFFPPEPKTRIPLPRHPREASDEEQFMLLPMSQSRASAASP
jgi:hypothetical protein